MFNRESFSARSFNPVSWAGLAFVRPSSGAGRPKRKRKYTVEIDGEEFAFDTASEAVQLLELARQQAEEKARLAVSRAAASPHRQRRRVLQDARKLLDMPAISAPAEIAGAVDDTLEQIRHIFAQALRDIEISMHLAQIVLRDDAEFEELLMIL